VLPPPTAALPRALTIGLPRSGSRTASRRLTSCAAHSRPLPPPRDLPQPAYPTPRGFRQPAAPAAAQAPAAAMTSATAQAPATAMTSAAAMTSRRRLGEAARGHGGRASREGGAREEVVGATLVGRCGGVAGAGWSHVLWLRYPQIVPVTVFYGASLELFSFHRLAGLLKKPVLEPLKKSTKKSC
jgi:hypothetical protein